MGQIRHTWCVLFTICLSYHLSISAVDGHLQLEELITMQQHAMQHDAEKVDENVATAVDAFFESMEVCQMFRVSPWAERFIGVADNAHSTRSQC